MASTGLKKKLGLVDLSLLGIGSMIGSGWLYAALNSSGYAGSHTGWAWVLGAVIVLMIGLVYARAVLSATARRRFCSLSQLFARQHRWFRDWCQLAAGLYQHRRGGS